MRVFFFKSSQSLSENILLAVRPSKKMGLEDDQSFPLLKNGLSFSRSENSFLFQGSTPGDEKAVTILSSSWRSRVTFFTTKKVTFGLFTDFFGLETQPPAKIVWWIFFPTEVVDEPSYASARLVDDEGSSLTTWAANCRTGFRSIQAENTDCNLAFRDMGVSKNRGTPKWMVYNGKPY